MRRLLICGLCLLFSIVMLPDSVLADGGDEYEIFWFTTTGGGGTSQGGGFSLTGNVGQPETGLVTGGQYNLAGGIHANELVTAAANPSLTDLIYLPVIQR